MDFNTPQKAKCQICGSPVWIVKVEGDSIVSMNSKRTEVICSSADGWKKVKGYIAHEENCKVQAKETTKS